MNRGRLGARRHRLRKWTRRARGCDRLYEDAHRDIRRSAGLLSGLLLQLGRFPALRRLAFRSFRRDPQLFEAMLALHSGAAPFSYWSSTGALTLGLQTLFG